ncbi:MAG: hypothetical protein DMG57_25770 [Acidobacteria bacterium]|nr:MAG: hypothetical protein DMG57_25770 [Acidobacteriota bacterium]
MCSFNGQVGIEVDLDGFDSVDCSEITGFVFPTKFFISFSYGDQSAAADRSSPQKSGKKNPPVSSRPRRIEASSASRSI